MVTQRSLLAPRADQAMVDYSVRPRATAQSTTLSSWRPARSGAAGGPPSPRCMLRRARAVAAPALGLQPAATRRCARSPAAPRCRRPARSDRGCPARARRAPRARPQRLRVGRPRLLDPPVGGPRAHPQRGLDLRGRLARLQPHGDREHVAHAAGHERAPAAASASPWARSSRKARVAPARRGPRARRRGPRPGARPTARRPPRPPRRRCARPSPCSRASVSSSRSRRCWRSPDMAISALAARAFERRSRGARPRPPPSAAAPWPSATVPRRRRRRPS